MVAFAVAALALQAVSIRQQQLASHEQRKATKKARSVDSRLASIENQRNKRRAIAQQRIEEASLIAASAADNTSGSSAVRGGLTGSRAGLAGSIGFQNTQLAAASARGAALQEGIDKAAGFNKLAGYAQVGASAFNLAYQRFGQPQANPNT